MLAMLLFLLFPFMILVIPIRFYKSCEPAAISFYTRLAYSSYGSKMMAYFLIAIGGFFHIVYFNAFPKEPGIMASTALLIALCNVNKSQDWLVWIRINKKWWMAMMILILVSSFIRFLLTSSIMLAFTLECAFLLPGDKMNDYDPTSSLSSNDKFVKYYFG